MDAFFILFYLISFGFSRYCCNDPCDFFLCCHPEFLVGFESSLQVTFPTKSTNRTSSYDDLSAIQSSLHFF